MAKRRSKRSLLRGRTVITPSGRKIVSLASAKKAYSLHEKKVGPISAIENAPHGSKGDAVRKWWQRVQDDKFATKQANKTIKRQDKKSVAGGKKFVDEYVKDQQEAVTLYDKALKKGGMTPKNEAIIRDKKFKAELRIKSAKKGAFGDLSQREITAMKKLPKSLSPQQMKQQATIEVLSKASKGSAASRLKNAKFTPNELAQYDVSRRVATTEAKTLKSLKQQLSKIEHVKEDFRVSKIMKRFRVKVNGKFIEPRTKKDLRANIKMLERKAVARDKKLKGFLKKSGLEAGDIPDKIYGKGGLLKYRAPGRQDFIDTTSIDTPKYDRHGIIETAGASSKMMTGASTKGNLASRKRAAEGYEVIADGRGSIISTGTRSTANVKPYRDTSYRSHRTKASKKAVIAQKKALQKRANEPAGTIKNKDARPADWKLGEPGKKYYSKEIATVKKLKLKKQVERQTKKSSPVSQSVLKKLGMTKGDWNKLPVSRRKSLLKQYLN